MTNESIAKSNGFKNYKSMQKCDEAMEKYNLQFAIDRHNFIKGWKEREKFFEDNDEL